MFRYFENLIDPYCEYTQTDTPSTTLWPFLRGYCRPKLCDCLCVWGFADVVTDRCKIDPAIAGVVAVV
jgi:hypothetical protein